MDQPARSRVNRVPPADTALAADLRRADALAKLMDGQYTIAGVGIGLDAIIGLLPFAGDAISFGIGLYPVYLARKHKLGSVVIARMMANLGLDFVAGSVPLIGDALDIFIRANIKNVALLKKAATRSDSRA